MVYSQLTGVMEFTHNHSSADELITPGDREALRSFPFRRLAEGRFQCKALPPAWNYSPLINVNQS